MSVDREIEWARLVALSRATTQLFREAVAEAEAAGCDHIEQLRQGLAKLEASELPEQMP